jgi:DNA-binding CsgD family transcriptional regulator
VRRNLEDTLSDITGSRTVEELQPLIDRIGRENGFSHCSYIDVRHVPMVGEPLPFFVTSVPNEFLSTYIQQNFVTFDPVVRRAAVTNAPFLWTDCRPFHSGLRRRPGVKGRAQRLLELASDFRFQQGYVVPCHAVDKAGKPASAFVSFYWPGNPDELKKPGTVPMWLRLAVSVYHERMLTLRGIAANDDDPPPALSDRELECLVWASRGKTNSDISNILGITPRTVEFHVTNAMRKLRVYNKLHAVAIAIQYGLISP